MIKMSFKDKCAVSRRIDEPQHAAECCIYSRDTVVSSKLQHLNQIEAVFNRNGLFVGPGACNSSLSCLHTAAACWSAEVTVVKWKPSFIPSFSAPTAVVCLL